MAKLEERRRFNHWPPIIPRVNTVVQLLLWGNNVIEGPVLARSKHENTYRIFVQTTLGYPLCLDITPGTDGSGMSDTVNDLRPWWRTIPEKHTETRHDVKVFFLD